MNVYLAGFISLFGLSILFDAVREKFYIHTKRILAPGFSYALFPEVAIMPCLYLFLLPRVGVLIAFLLPASIGITLIFEFLFYLRQSLRHQVGEDVA